MNSNGKRFVEGQFQASQLYKTLRDSGIPAADQLARGLGKAAQGLDGALESVAPVVKRRIGRAERFYGTYGAAPGSGPAGGQTSQPVAGPGKGGYAYRYPGAGTQQTNPPPRAASRAPQNAYPGRKPQGVQPAPAPQMPQMKLVRKGSPVKYYITAVTALLYALNFSLYRPGDYVAFAIVLAAVFFLSGAIFKGKKEWVPIEAPKPQKAEKKEPAPQQEEKTSKTGNPEVDKIIEEGNGYLKKLRAANNAIPDEILSEDIERMERASADIFRFIADHPEKASQIRKFMNYYLPTTLKLLGSYQRLSAQSVKGENITSTMFNIAGMMHTVADAFEKQLDSLFTDEAMDISADISVFETMLKQEGFVEEKESRPQ